MWSSGSIEFDKGVQCGARKYGKKVGPNRCVDLTSDDLPLLAILPKARHHTPHHTPHHSAAARPQYGTDAF